MALPPKPPSSGERLAEAAAAAEAAARRAGETASEDSRALTDRLLAGGIEARFTALSDAGLQLMQADRRRLLVSLAGREPPRRTIPVGTASRWALIRSRLPYRVTALASSGLMAAVLVTGVLVARANTPLGMVVSDASRDLPLAFALKDGRVVFYTLEAGKAYPFVRQEGDMAVLRRWVPGTGYAEARVPVMSMHWAPEGLAPSYAEQPSAEW